MIAAQLATASAGSVDYVTALLVAISSLAGVVVTLCLWWKSAYDSLRGDHKECERG